MHHAWFNVLHNIVEVTTITTKNSKKLSLICVCVCWCVCEGGITVNEPPTQVSYVS